MSTGTVDRERPTPSFSRGPWIRPASMMGTASTWIVSLFGLHRRLVGCLLGHLAVFEMTSVTPMSRYAEACDRLHLRNDVRRFYEVHVTADAHHGQLSRDRLLGGDLRAEGIDPADVV